MTPPIVSSSTEEKAAKLGWRTDQVERRPGHSRKATYEIKVFADDGRTGADVTSGDGKFIFAIPEDVDGMSLTRVEAFVTTVSSSGIVQVQIRNITQAVDMLTTRVQVDASEKNSLTAATQPVIDTANDDVAQADEIAIDVDQAGTGAKGLGVILEFS